MIWFFYTNIGTNKNIHDLSYENKIRNSERERKEKVFLWIMIQRKFEFNIGENILFYNQNS